MGWPELCAEAGAEAGPLRCHHRQAEASTARRRHTWALVLLSLLLGIGYVFRPQRQQQWPSMCFWGPLTTGACKRCTTSLSASGAVTSPPASGPANDHQRAGDSTIIAGIFFWRRLFFFFPLMYTCTLMYNILYYFNITFAFNANGSNAIFFINVL